MDGLEMQLRRALKGKLARGHVELTLSIDRLDSQGFALNRELVGGYIAAFRNAAKEIKALISASERQVGEGVDLVTQTDRKSVV